MAELQRKAYLPLFAAHLNGVLLDIGCGPVPYFEAYKPLVSEIICLDHPKSIHGVDHLDHRVDLNQTERLPFPDDQFDSVLSTDMIVHVHKQHDFVKELARVLKPGGKAIITSSFVNWIGEYPYEFGHPCGTGLRSIANNAGLEVIHLASYGGHADVLLDTLNKFFANGIMNRFFLLFAYLVEATGWPRRNRERTRDRYALGNCMVVRKPL